MHPVPGKCPVCGEDLAVTRLHCRACDSALEGHFGLGRFYQLSPEQLHFVETFIRCEGKISRMEDEIGLSYPTIRNRLQEVIRALGYEPGGNEETTRLSEQERQRILEDLDKGLISAEKAMHMLKESE